MYGMILRHLGKSWSITLYSISDMQPYGQTPSQYRWYWTFCSTTHVVYKLHRITCKREGKFQLSKFVDHDCNPWFSMACRATPIWIFKPIVKLSHGGKSPFDGAQHWSFSLKSEMQSTAGTSKQEASGRMRRGSVEHREDRFGMDKHAP